LGSEYTGNSVGSGLSGRIADRRTGGFRPPSAGFPWALEQGTTARRSGSFLPGTGSPEVRERALRSSAREPRGARRGGPVSGGLYNQLGKGAHPARITSSRRAGLRHPRSPPRR
jgi:hypothetical protein